MTIMQSLVLLVATFSVWQKLKEHCTSLVFTIKELCQGAVSFSKGS
jgi:hypothetical protein